MKSLPMRTLYWPMFILYFGFPIVRDLLSFYSSYSMDDWLALLALYAMGVVISLPLFHFLHKSKNKTGYLKPSNYLVPVAGLLSQVCGLVLFWDSSVSLYLYMPIVMVVSFIILAYLSKDVILVRDQDTGTVYKFKNGKLLRTTAQELTSYQGVPARYEISSSSISGFDCSASIIPFDSSSFGISSSEHHGGLTINPSSGLPMIGGISGLDINGNTFGTTFNDSNSNYDSSRGY